MSLRAVGTRWLDSTRAAAQAAAGYAREVSAQVEPSVQAVREGIGLSSAPLSKRSRVSRLSAALGITHVIERAARRPCIVVINYHRVTDPETCAYDRGVIDATPAQFDDQMKILRQRYNVATLNEVVALVEDPSRLRHAHVLITFDDGYRDNYQQVFPILQSHGLHGVFFLATGFLGTNRVSWWDQIANAMRRSSRAEFLLRYPRELRIKTGPAFLEKAIRDVLHLYIDPATTDTARFLREFEESCGAPLIPEIGEPMYMTPAEAATMARAGMAIGAHSHSHELMAKLSEEQQMRECQMSREILERTTSLPCQAFAYPVGEPHTFSETTVRCLKATGFRVAFSQHGGINRPDTLTRFNLRRIDVDRGDGISEFRLRFSVAAMTARQIW